MPPGYRWVRELAALGTRPHTYPRGRGLGPAQGGSRTPEGKLRLQLGRDLAM